MFDRQDPQSAIRWLDVKNASGFQVPSYGVMLVTGYDAATGAFTIGRPNADSIEPAKLLINGPGPIDDGKLGAATKDFPVLAKVNTGAAIAQAGTEINSFTLSTSDSRKGFFLWQAVTDGLAVVNAVVGSGSVCQIPDNVLDLDPDELFGLAFYPLCCRQEFIVERCREDGTGKEWRWEVFYLPYKVRKVVGEWETNYPPSYWGTHCPEPGEPDE